MFFCCKCQTSHIYIQIVVFFRYFLLNLADCLFQVLDVNVLCCLYGVARALVLDLLLLLDGRRVGLDGNLLPFF